MGRERSQQQPCIRLHISMDRRQLNSGYRSEQTHWGGDCLPADQEKLFDYRYLYCVWSLVSRLSIPCNVLSEMVLQALSQREIGLGCVVKKVSL